MEKQVKSCWPHTAAHSRLPWGRCSTGRCEHPGSHASHSGAGARGAGGVGVPGAGWSCKKLRAGPCNTPLPALAHVPSLRQPADRAGVPESGSKAPFQGISCGKSL